MPGVGMKCLNTVQPIFGVDLHRTCPPPSVPLPFAPHVVIWGEGWSQKLNFLWARANSKATSPESSCTCPVSCDWGYAIGRTHDAGPHPAHVWPNLLLPLIMLGSGSKSEFASGTVLTPKGNQAVAVAYFVNFNLDCQDFPIPPLPTGVVVAAFATVEAGFTLGDFLGGLLSMVIDMAISWISGLIVSGFTSFLSGLGRGVVGAWKSVFRGGAGFLGPLWRGFTRGVAQNMRDAFKVPFVSKLTPQALASAFVQGGRTVFDPSVLNASPYITGPAGTLTSIYGVGSPVGYSSSSSIYGRATEGTVDHPDAHDPNAIANRIGHGLAGESSESSSSFYSPPESKP